MKKNITIILFIFFTSFIFSQNNISNNNEQTKIPTLSAIEKNQPHKNILAIKKDAINKPEIKQFAIHQLDTTNKKIDSIIISEPKLIPYTGYKKENDY